MLLRRVIGDALRARRQGQQRTLREISTAANVSLGYLSEIERGQKEASSELLAAICDALGSHMSEVLREASDSLARVEGAGAAADSSLAEPVPAGQRPVPGQPAAAAEPARASAGVPHSRPAIEPLAVPAAGASAGPERPVPSISDGSVTVSIRRDGPLRTTLHAVRARRRGQPVGS